jgi:hypothetical protein
MNVNEFFLDLWADLREKRLWPVAVALLVGLVAVPVVLSKPSEDAPVLPPPAASQAEGSDEVDGLAALSVAEDRTGAGSSLDVFDSSDPFKPPQDVIESSEDDPAMGAPDSAGGDTSATTGGGATGGAITPTTGTTPDTGGAPGDTGGTTTVEYRYVIDVTFTANGRKRKIKGMERLDILPKESNPLLIFLGASSNGGNAVFLVDSTLETAGEGKCRPSEEDCAFVHMGPGNVQEFTNEQGDAYTLRVDQIRRVKVKAEAASKKDTEKQDDGGASASAAFEERTTVRRFVPPLITDLVTVVGASDELSDGDPSGR